jgi:hypothetical protein
MKQRKVIYTSTCIAAVTFATHNYTYVTASIRPTVFQNILNFVSCLCIKTDISE